ncbi:MAG: hypothetical protein U0165_15955 [Polyangiaceae bacterium]
MKLEGCLLYFNAGWPEHDAWQGRSKDKYVRNRRRASLAFSPLWDKGG